MGRMTARSVPTALEVTKTLPMALLTAQHAVQTAARRGVRLKRKAFWPLNPLQVSIAALMHACMHACMHTRVAPYGTFVYKYVHCTRTVLIA
jgi:hypothetical protein